MNQPSARTPHTRPSARFSRRSSVLLLAIVACAACVGCSPRIAEGIRLTSYRDPYFPETFEMRPDTCVYRKDRTGDYHVLVHSIRAADDAGGAPVEQWLHLHIYWRPRPGKTVDDPSSLDATLTYLVAGAESKTRYSGSAFAYPEKARFGDDLLVSIEGARMTPRAEGDESDMLGATRVLGKVRARSDAAAAVDLERQMRIMSSSLRE